MPVQLKKLSLIIAILSGLSACSTTQSPPKTTNNAITDKQHTQQQPVTAKQFLTKAVSKSGIARIQLLYQTREQAILEKDWHTLEQACLELENKNTVDHVQNKLYVAFARKELNAFESALSILRVLEERLTLPEHKAWFHYLNGSIYASQDLPKKALVHFFKAADLSESHQLTVAGLDEHIWQALRQVSSYALERFDRGTVLQRGWVVLAKYHQIYLGNGLQLDQAINNWRRRHPAHPAHAIIPGNIDTLASITPFKPKRIAVLLPQSGNSERLGEALKTGMLAAFDKTQAESLIFIDETQPLNDIEQGLSEVDPDFIIGPLLKSNVSKILESSFIQTRPTLLLNTSEQQTINPDHYFFALNPEHEVKQAMIHFLAQGYQKPMILAPAGASGERLVDHFNHNWSRFSNIAPEVGFYTDSKNMAEVIKHLLEVDSSKARSHVIASLFKQEVEFETRSRRDIDVIYILGDATETRLLKPYLDVNVSTFADRIPLYASSRSHSKQIDRTDKGDLEGLYFTEQPWMLPNSIAHTNLRNEYQALWPEQADIEQRLFAMAYDALNIIGELKQLNAVPGKSFEGLTGRLSITTNNTLDRHLTWAQYRNKKIQLVSLDERAPTPLFMQE